MTRDQDIERVLDQWFIEGPTQMPSRFLDDTLDRIDRAPQHRLARLQTRLLAMHPDLRFAAAAAIVLAVAGIGVAVLTQTGGIGSPSTGSGALPASLQAEWHPVGTRPHMGLSGDTAASDLDIVIDPTTITVFEWHGDVVALTSLVGADRLELRTIRTGMVWHGKTLYCQIGDAATYTFSLSSGDQRLTLTPVNDACAERANILPGDWTRTPLGPLAPGRHVSQSFRPLGGGTSGQFSFTVPTGWTESEETSSGLSLWRPGVSDAASIRLFSNVVPVSNSPDAGCAASPADVQGTPAAVAAWLVTRLAVTPPIPVTIGGLSGVMVDVSDDPSLVTCPDLFVDFTYSGGMGLSGENRARLVLLDRGDGQILLISIEASDDATWDALVADAMPIVQSFEFTR
jgi:hypothetical protein